MYINATYMGATLGYSQISIMQNLSLIYLRTPKLIFKHVLLVILLLTTGIATAQTAVATYESIGIYWPEVGGQGIDGRVSYRQLSSQQWLPAHDLWYDARPKDEWHGQEYRGSIVGLKSGHTYEIKLELSTGLEKQITVKTLTSVESLPVREVVKVASGESGLIIEKGGDVNGYIVYDGLGAQISDGEQVGVTIDADYVILKNLTVSDIGKHGIEIKTGRHHIVIDGCEISTWGERCGEWQAEMNNGIHSDGCINNITIQNCKIHHPRYDANSWAEYLCGKTDDTHPGGARGIGFHCDEPGSQYQLVIRDNEIYSDRDHMFNDGMGNNRNFSYSGFPGMDSDIYRNKVSHVWDDGLEIEGANANVRVYENEIDTCNIAFGLATTSVGPLYVFRNISRWMQAKQGYDFGWSLFKLGLNEKEKNEKWYRGKIYLYHNISLQPHGVNVGVGPSTIKKRQYYVTSRNNVLWCGSNSIAATAPTTLPKSDLDYDLYSAEIPEGYEPNGIQAEPVMLGDCLDVSSSGFDAGVVIPNFNDAYSAWPFLGKAPDMGAMENDAKKK